MLTTTLSFDEFFSSSADATGPEQAPWLGAVAELLAPLPVRQILLATQLREPLFFWHSPGVKPLLELESLEVLSKAGIGEMRIESIDRTTAAAFRQDETEAGSLEPAICVILADDPGASEISAAQKTVRAAVDLAMRLGRQQKSLEVLEARNKQLIRQQQAFKKEHDQTLEAALRERDERIKEQRTYLERLEREVAMRTMEIKEQTIQLQRANAHMKRNLDSAARIQAALLPTTLPKRPNMNFSWKFRPCDELAGDSLNVFNLDEDQVGLYVLDVSGHGVPSALLSVTLSRFLMPATGQSSFLKTPSDQPPFYNIASPSEVASKLNESFQMNDTTEQYFTILYGIYNVNTREFRYVSAGHPGLVHSRADGTSRLCETESFAIGWFEDVEYEEHVLQLTPGDRIYLYSDGITESANLNGEAFGDARLLEAVNRSRNVDLHASVAELFREVVEWTELRSPQDDLSLLAFEVTG